MIIDEILEQDNYAHDRWAARGLNPSPSDTIALMERSTKAFLTELKLIANDPDWDEEAKANAVAELVDDLPWDELDTEEKEFLADVLAPAIESVGLNPWELF